MPYRCLPAGWPPILQGGTRGRVRRVTPEQDPAVVKLQQLLRIPTVSYADERADPTPFRDFLAAHQRLFPRLHAELERTVLNGTANWMMRKVGISPQSEAQHVHSASRALPK